jgi:cell wall-associated NlpC family hydrolase
MPKRNAHRLAIACLQAAVATLMIVSPASGSSGGLGPDPVPGPRARITAGGQAVPPADAPPQVVRAIAFANRIEDDPYRWGGGHASFRDDAYDCSGAVSVLLHGARTLGSPLDSSALMRWGRAGKGDWITIYSNPGHVYAVIAGLRWDTSMTPGDGPGWSSEMRSPRGFVRRFSPGL